MIRTSQAAADHVRQVEHAGGCSVGVAVGLEAVL
jgi:hypothetical protein